MYHKNIVLIVPILFSIVIMLSSIIISINEIAGESIDQSSLKVSSQEQATKTVETRIGNLTLQSGYLNPETAQKLKDELFFQRAIQVYQLALPAVSGAGIFYDFYNADKIGTNITYVFYWSEIITSDVEILTANISVLYLLIFFNLSEGPMVIDVPGGIYGAVNNLYQQPLIDVGLTGPDKGQGGLFLVLPPNYNGSIPENYFVVESDTTQSFFAGRSFINNDGDKSNADNLIKQLQIYPLSQANNPPEQKFIDLKGQSLKLSYPTTNGFWEFLHKVYSNEKNVRDEDKNLIGLMHTIGIIPGQPFEPSEHSKKLLDEAAIVADLMAKNIAYDSPVKENYIYYPNSNWELGFMTDNPNFEDKSGVTQIDPRLAYVYQAITTSDGMVKDIVGSGSKYLLNYRDGNENWLNGSNTYKLNVPPNVPVERFWSAVIYDAETRSLIQNDLQPRPGITSVNVGNLTQNDDGSYDLYFGPESPVEGYENNWIKTNEGKGFFVVFRFYSPTEAYFDKSWQLPNIELIQEK